MSIDTATGFVQGMKLCRSFGGNLVAVISVAYTFPIRAILKPIFECKSPLSTNRQAQVFIVIQYNFIMIVYCESRRNNFDACTSMIASVMCMGKQQREKRRTALLCPVLGMFGTGSECSSGCSHIW